MIDFYYNKKRDYSGLKSTISELGFLQPIIIDQKDNQWEIEIFVGNEKLKKGLSIKLNRQDFQRTRTPSN